MKEKELGTLSNIDDLYIALSFAYGNNDKENMRLCFGEIFWNYPGYRQRIYDEIKSLFLNNGYRNMVIVPISEVPDDFLRLNAEGCLYAIYQILRERSYNLFSFRAIQALYYPAEAFRKNTCLYTKNLDFGKNSISLTAGDVLSVMDYFFKAVNIFYPNEKTEKMKDCMLILKSIDYALNNNWQERTVKKSFHLVNDVLASVVRKSLKNEKDKHLVDKNSLLLDLVIDFFYKI